MDNIIAIAILAAILGAALIYIVRRKKKGARCIACSAPGCSCKSCGTQGQ